MIAGAGPTVGRWNAVPPPATVILVEITVPDCPRRGAACLATVISRTRVGGWGADVDRLECG